VCLAEVDAPRGAKSLKPLLVHYEPVVYDDDDDDGPEGDGNKSGAAAGGAAGGGAAAAKMSAAAKQAEKEKRAVLKKLDTHKEELNAFKLKLLKGIKIEKLSGSSGTKKPKTLHCVGPDFRCITWEGRTRDASLDMDEVEKVERCLVRNAGKGGDATLSMALVGGDYTLDMELPTSQERDEVALGFELFLSELAQGKDRYVDDTGICRQRKQILFTMATDELRLLTGEGKCLLSVSCLLVLTSCD
jgi:hypothetical protein